MYRLFHIMKDTVSRESLLTVVGIVFGWQNGGKGDELIPERWRDNNNRVKERSDGEMDRKGSSDSERVTRVFPISRSALKHGPHHHRNSM